MNKFKYVFALAFVAALSACSYTKAPSTIEKGSSVGATGDVGYTHESLGGQKHLIVVTAAPGLMETEGSIAQRIHISANKIAAQKCTKSFDFAHDPNFDQQIAAGFMKRTKTYVFVCKD